MGQALYRQYRPKSLQDVVGQEHITVTILHALKQGKLAHAYLFTGPRGVGKTSIARILAHEINGLPYEDDSVHLDIIEIDAASNRRIDEIRELRDKVNIAPSLAKYKVYIIDEVHMLTREAFNALLKTLEEPPAHAVFILATTESHKLPETIVSRTQRFIFKPVPLEQVAAHLRQIAEKEEITITDEAVTLIANHGEGSFRDSISLLDQTRGHDGQVDADYVRSLIGIPTDEAIDALVTSLAAGNAAVISNTLESLRTQGFAAPQVAKHLGQRLRADVLAGKGQAGVFELMEKLLEVPVAHDPEAYMELTLLSQALSGRLPTAAPAPRQAVVAQAAPDKPQQSQPVDSPTPATPKPQTAVTKPEPKFEAPPAAPKTQAEPIDTLPQELREPIAVDDNLWPEILNSLKKTHNTLYGIARMATPVFYEDKLELAFSFAFHKRRLSETKNKDIVCNVIKQLTGKDMGLSCILISKGIQTTPPSVSTPATVPVGTGASPDINAISNIFGGAEILDA